MTQNFSFGSLGERRINVITCKISASLCFSLITTLHQNACAQRNARCLSEVLFLEPIKNVLKHVPSAYSPLIRDEPALIRCSLSGFDGRPSCGLKIIVTGDFFLRLQKYISRYFVCQHLSFPIEGSN